MQIDEDKVKSMIEDALKNYLSDNRVDDGKISRDSLEYQVSNKVDSRNIVTHTFTGTSEESFLHNLGRIPNGWIVLNQTQAAAITGDDSKWTKQKVYMTSSVGTNKVKILFL